MPACTEVIDELQNDACIGVDNYYRICIMLQVTDIPFEVIILKIPTNVESISKHGHLSDLPCEIRKQQLRQKITVLAVHTNIEDLDQREIVSDSLEDLLTALDLQIASYNLVVNPY